MAKKVQLALVCCLCACAAFAQNGWQVLTTNTNLNLLAVQAYSDDTIFMAGDDGILLKSFDGGATFTTHQNALNQIYTAVFFQTASIGFVGNGLGDVKRTTDGGQSFTAVSNCNCFIKSILFSSPIHGMYSGNDTYRSSNAGLNFVNISPFTPTNRFSSPADSVFVSYRYGIIKRSGDFGQTFTNDTVHTATNFQLVHTRFTSATHGYAMTSDGYLYETTNQGMSWSLAVIPATNLAISNFVFLDSLRGFLIAGNFKDHIYKTTNGGQTWTLDFIAPEVLDDIAVHGSVVYACGQDGYAVKNDFYTAIDEPQKPQAIQLFPNPATGTTRLLVSENSIGQTAYLKDLSGRILKTIPITSTETTINIDEYRAGVYLFCIDTGHVQRLIKL
jgi:photosystem II stability/assembly factor-like uncharacterized protein